MMLDLTLFLNKLISPSLNDKHLNVLPFSMFLSKGFSNCLVAWGDRLFDLSYYIYIYRQYYNNNVTSSLHAESRKIKTVV